MPLRDIGYNQSGNHIAPVTLINKHTFRIDYVFDGRSVGFFCYTFCIFPYSNVSPQKGHFGKI